MTITIKSVIHHGDGSTQYAVVAGNAEWLATDYAAACKLALDVQQAIERATILKCTIITPWSPS